jgi:hypothetical protein
VADRAANVRQERSGAAPRGHARDGFKWSAARKNESEKVFIKNLQDVAHSSFELYPENSEVFHFLKILPKKNYFLRAQN